MSSGALQSFFIQLELDGGKAVIKEIKEVEKAEEGLKEKTEKTGKSFDILKDTLARTAGNTGLGGFLKYARASLPALAALAAAGVALKAALNTVNFAKQAEDLLFMANSAGIAANKMQTLALASEAAGGTRQGAAATVANIGQQIEQARMNNFQSTGLYQAAKLYGLQVTDANGVLITDAAEILKNVARLFDEIKDPLKQVAIKNLVGIDDGTFRNLQKGYKGYMAALAQAEANRLFSPQDEKDITRLTNSLRQVKIGFQKLGAGLAIELLPTVTTFVQELEKFTKSDTGKDFTKFASGIIETWLLLTHSFVIGIDMIVDGLKEIVSLTIALAQAVWEAGKKMGLKIAGNTVNLASGIYSFAAKNAKEAWENIKTGARSIQAADSNTAWANLGATVAGGNTMGDFVVYQNFYGNADKEIVKSGVEDAFAQIDKSRKFWGTLNSER